MDLIERYIYAVTRRLPEKQRDDIAKELRSLIEDMLAQRAGDGSAPDAEIKAVLTELGEPSALAAKYSGRPRHLIGPELFDTYLFVLKIAVAAAVFGVLVALIVNYSVTPPQYIGEVFGNVIGSAISAAIEGFAWVTLVFALIERFAMDKVGNHWFRRKWDPGDLPEIPLKNELIRRHQPIVAIILIVIFCIILNSAPSLFAVYRLKSGLPPITVFNLGILRAYMPLINICFAVSAIKEIMKLVYGRYNLRFAVTNTVLSCISFILSVIVFSNFHIWNWNFVSSLNKAYSLALPAGFDATQPVITFAKVILGLIVFVFAVETIKTVVKTARFSSPNIKRFIKTGR